ncbi:MAG TPA: hypothetical protein VF407_09570 [Polyangiaceae bacterium]
MSDESRADDPRADVRGAALVFIAKIVVSIWVLDAGFSHVSDDDYARAVISEQFAHAPSLDPSGTSWLPFPFWIAGSAMALFGRTLEVARGVAVVSSALATTLAYLAVRELPTRREPALVGTVIALALPWNAWLGATFVPEGFAAPLMVAGMATMRAPRVGARVLGAVALLAASLSRYDAWPACVAFFVCSLSLRPDPKRVALHAVPLAGPLGWMIWNLHAHGSATHFLTRVAAYREAIGAGGNPLGEELMVYPRALLATGFEPLVLGGAGVVVLALRRDVRARWAAPLFACLAIAIFLVYGETRGGAPTHHPERALVAVAWLLVVFGVDAIATALEQASRRARFTAGAAAIAGVFLTLPGRYARAPARDASENRDRQIERGLDYRDRGAKHLAVTPCAYEHFALIAAYGAPERVDVANVSPHDAVAHRPDATCPSVQEN